MPDLAREIAPAASLPPPAAAPLAAAELPLAQRGLLDGRFTFIDGLRGIAALGVAGFHFYRMSRPTGPAWIMWPVSIILTHGDLGVSIFFVISGFVMAHSLRNAWISPKYFGNFVFRRSLRLDPPYWAVIGLALLAQWLLPAYAAGPPQPVAIWPHFLYLQDIFGPYKDNSIVGVFWTLCLEVQFYLVFILCLCLVQQGVSHFEGRKLKLSAGAPAAIGRGFRNPTSLPHRHRFQTAAMIVFIPLLLGSLLVQHATVQGDLPGHGHTSRRAKAAAVAGTPKPAAPPAAQAIAPPAQPAVASEAALQSTAAAPSSHHHPHRAQAAPAAPPLAAAQLAAVPSPQSAAASPASQFSPSRPPSQSAGAASPEQSPLPPFSLPWYSGGGLGRGFFSLQDAKATTLGAASPRASGSKANAPASSRGSSHASSRHSPRSSGHGLSLSNWRRGFFLRYWYTFFLGVMIYWVLGRAVHIAWLIAAAAAIALMMGLDFRDLNALNHTAIVLAAGALIFTVGHAGNLGRWFGNRILQYLGRISYSLYLIHLVAAVPLLNWLLKLHPPHRGQSLLIPWLFFFAGLAISLLAADILYRLIERPAVKFSKRFKPRNPTNEPAEPVAAEIVMQALPT